MVECSNFIQAIQNRLLIYFYTLDVFPLITAQTWNNNLRVFWLSSSVSSFPPLYLSQKNILSGSYSWWGHSSASWEPFCHPRRWGLAKKCSHRWKWRQETICLQLPWDPVTTVQSAFNTYFICNKFVNFLCFDSVSSWPPLFLMHFFYD